MAKIQPTLKNTVEILKKVDTDNLLTHIRDMEKKVKEQKAHAVASARKYGFTTQKLMDHLYGWMCAHKLVPAVFAIENNPLTSAIPYPHNTVAIGLSAQEIRCLMEGLFGEYPLMIHGAEEIHIFYRTMIAIYRLTMLARNDGFEPMVPIGGMDVRIKRKSGYVPSHAEQIMEIFREIVSAATTQKQWNVRQVAEYIEGYTRAIRVRIVDSAFEFEEMELDAEENNKNEKQGSNTWADSWDSI